MQAEGCRTTDATGTAGSAAATNAVAGT